mgnify:CR=1 FL=1
MGGAAKAARDRQGDRMTPPGTSLDPCCLAQRLAPASAVPPARAEIVGAGRAGPAFGRAARDETFNRTPQPRASPRSARVEAEGRNRGRGPKGDALMAIPDHEIDFHCSLRNSVHQNSDRRCTGPQRSASLIGRLGQARLPCINRIGVAHPGHASLRSLVARAPLQAFVGSAVESLALRRALLAQQTFSASSTNLVR